MTRQSQLKRKTAETEVFVNLNLDGKGETQSDTKIGFLDHMLTLFGAHGGFDLKVVCDGDIQVDFHHSAEDIGITLGKAFSDALKDKAGIRRYGNIILPMDEALVLCAADFSGRSYLNFDVAIPSQKVGDFDTELVKEFLAAFVRTAGLTLHLKLFYGENSHHIIEAVFKALGRTLKQAVSIDEGLGGKIPSTKGEL